MPVKGTCAIALTLLLSSCQGGHQKTIAVIPKGTAHLFWISVKAGAMAAGKKLDVNILWNGPAQETEYDRQIQILDYARLKTFACECYEIVRSLFQNYYG